jgi:low temperature requirement protein LtrA
METRIHYVWWIVLPLESIVILIVSSVWRILSFKESHMAERLSLLTMIIIGEGVIGSTKTAGALWPTTSNPTSGGVVAMVSIIVMLVSFTAHDLENKNMLTYPPVVNVAIVL